MSVVAAVGSTATAVAFGAAVTGGQLLRLTIPGGRRTTPVGLAAALAYALVLQVGDRPATHGVLGVVVVVALAGLLASLTHLLAGRSAQWIDLGRLVAAATAAALVVRPGADMLALRPEEGAVLPVLGLAAVLGVAVHIGLGSVQRARVDHAPLVPTARDDALALGQLAAATAATALLTALVAPLMGLWSLPVFALPLLVTQIAFRRYAGIRLTFRQTIRSLSRVTEIGGFVARGHSARVSELAVAVGREFGLGDRDLLDLEYAALLHDIGQLSLASPVRGGSTLVVPPLERRRLAAHGADIVRSTGQLDRVATIVEKQADPYRRHREATDAEVPLASRIVKAVSAYDDLREGALGDPVPPQDALERLRLGMAYDYDPQVVEALSRVVSRG